MHSHDLALGSMFRTFVEQPDGLMTILTQRGYDLLREERNVTKREARKLWRALLAEGYVLYASSKVRTPKGWVDRSTHATHREPVEQTLPGIL